MEIVEIWQNFEKKTPRIIIFLPIICGRKIIMMHRSKILVKPCHGFHDRQDVVKIWPELSGQKSR